MATVQGTFPQVAVKPATTAQSRSRIKWAVPLSVLLCVAVLFVWYRPLTVFDGVTEVKLAMAGMRNETVMLDGHRIHYLVGGQGSPVLLVHGLGSRATDFADLIPPIVRSGHRVYAIDLLGYGESDRPQNSDFSIREESKIVEDFIVSENLQHFDLAGWSMGGWISMVVATEMPERVSKLILLDSAGNPLPTELRSTTLYSVQPAAAEPAGDLADAGQALYARLRGQGAAGTISG